MSKGKQISAGATVIAFLVGWYAFTNLEPGSSFTYFQTLDEFRAAAAAQEGEHARVHGYVAPGSIERDLAQRRVVFNVVNDPPHAGGPPGPELRVVYTSLETPDLFKDGAEVVVEGMLAGDTFHADKVMAKCPSKFEAADPTQQALL
ncbi:MAG: cytochrome c maturation protein CcmE [Deltaproteobacteria bacterium]|nr:cytochrome c maturation protein CcmE [Deltaproteobacteria bacterium]MBW2361375.1 cytochrome c maturation protein CcmE [Deltaproteobacteria bacterium]